MTQIILHHFDISPFAEKVRLAFGIKNLEWQSVQIPLIMPKPDLIALTGGYRKTPVMQIGADIYCDTQRIAIELERRFPEHTLFPDGCKAFSTAFSSWSDAAFFQPGAGLSMGTNQGLPEDLLNDRMEFFEFMDFAELPNQLPHLYSQFDAHLNMLEQMLSERGYFLSGESPGWLDVLAYFPVWMCRSNITNSKVLLQPYERLQLWQQTMASIGHGTRTELAAHEALRIARESNPSIDSQVDVSAFPKLHYGDLVSISASDYGRDPVHGELIGLDRENISVRRSTEQLGDLVVHFPRIGYTVNSVE
ncbi:MAG: glutathione S-transferase [Pseudomonadota bacterium]